MFSVAASPLPPCPVTSWGMSAFLNLLLACQGGWEQQLERGCSEKRGLMLVINKMCAHPCSLPVERGYMPVCIWIVLCEHLRGWVPEQLVRDLIASQQPLISDGHIVKVLSVHCCIHWFPNTDLGMRGMYMFPNKCFLGL